MKRRQMLYSSVVVIVLILASFFVGSASASTGCFTDTNGNWAETFICWMKDNGITSGVGGGLYDPNGYVTRAQMAVFLQKQAEVPPSTGAIYINAGYNGFVPAAGSAGTIGYYSDWNELRSAAAGTRYFLLTPDLPTTFYGRQLYLSGVKVCYIGSATNYITTVYLKHYLQNGGVYNTLTDTTDRTTDACTTFSFTNAGSFYGGEHVTLELDNTYGAAGVVGIRAVTFIMNPSNFTGNLKEADKEPLNVDMPTEIGPDGHIVEP